MWHSSTGHTTDSSICKAAIHAGAITKEAGGSVTVKKAAGCSKYEANEANEVKTSGWGSYEASYFFVGKGEGKCPA